MYDHIINDTYQNTCWILDQDYGIWNNAYQQTHCIRRGIIWYKSIRFRNSAEAELSELNILNYFHKCNQ